MAAPGRFREELLRGIFAFLDAAMGISGLALLAYSIYAYEQLLHPRTHDAHSTMLRSSPDNIGDPELNRENGYENYCFDDLRLVSYVIILFYGMSGAWACLTALVGLADCGRKRCECVHRTMLCIGILWGLVGVARIYMWFFVLDGSGECQPFRKLALSLWEKCSYIWLAVVVFQVADAFRYWKTNGEKDEREGPSV